MKLKLILYFLAMTICISTYAQGTRDSLVYSILDSKELIEDSDSIMKADFNCLKYIKNKGKPPQVSNVIICHNHRDSSIIANAVNRGDSIVFQNTFYSFFYHDLSIRVRSNEELGVFLSPVKYVTDSFVQVSVYFTLVSDGFHFCGYYAPCHRFDYLIEILSNKILRHEYSWTDLSE